MSLVPTSAEQKELNFSPYVVHFTTPTDRLRPAIDEINALSQVVRDDATERGILDIHPLLCILADQWVYASNSRFGPARDDQRLGESQRAACFSETPLGLLGQLIEQHSPWGLAFSKSMVAGRGGAPVWNLEKDKPVAKAFLDLCAEAAREDVFAAENPIWKLTPFIEQPGEYVTERSQYRKRWEWLREWRIPGPNGLSFEPRDVAFIFAPEDDHEAIRNLFAPGGEPPGYQCAVVDPVWTKATIDARIRQAFKVK